MSRGQAEKMHVPWTLCAAMVEWHFDRLYDAHEVWWAVASQAEIVLHYIIFTVIKRQTRRTRLLLIIYFNMAQKAIYIKLHMQGNLHWKRFIPRWTKIGSHHLCLQFCLAIGFRYQSHFHIRISQSVGIHGNQIFPFINCDIANTWKKFYDET